MSNARLFQPNQAVMHAQELKLVNMKILGANCFSRNPYPQINGCRVLKSYTTSPKKKFLRAKFYAVEDKLTGNSDFAFIDIN